MSEKQIINEIVNEHRESIKYLIREIDNLSTNRKVFKKTVIRKNKSVNNKKANL